VELQSHPEQLNGGDHDWRRWPRVNQRFGVTRTIYILPTPYIFRGSKIAIFGLDFQPKSNLRRSISTQSNIWNIPSIYLIERRWLIFVLMSLVPVWKCEICLNFWPNDFKALYLKYKMSIGSVNDCFISSRNFISVASTHLINRRYKVTPPPEKAGPFKLVESSMTHPHIGRLCWRDPSCWYGSQAHPCKPTSSTCICQRERRTLIQ